MSFKLPKLVNTRCFLAPSVKAVKDVATSITITWKSFLDHLLQIMSKRKWDVPNQESIFKVFIDKCKTFHQTDFIENWVDALKVWNQ